MPAIAGEVPDVIQARVEAIKFGVPIDIVDNRHVIVYGTDEKASQVIARSGGKITNRKNMVRRRGQ